MLYCCRVVAKLGGVEHGVEGLMCEICFPSKSRAREPDARDFRFVEIKPPKGQLLMIKVR